MAISFCCPGCRKEFSVSDASAGKKGRCKRCGSLMQIPLTVDPVPRPKAQAKAKARFEPDPEPDDPYDLSGLTAAARSSAYDDDDESDDPYATAPADDSPPLPRSTGGSGAGSRSKPGAGGRSRSPSGPLTAAGAAVAAFRDREDRRRMPARLQAGIVVLASSVVVFGLLPLMASGARPARKPAEAPAPPANANPVVEAEAEAEPDASPRDRPSAIGRSRAVAGRDDDAADAPGIRAGANADANGSDLTARINSARTLDQAAAAVRAMHARYATGPIKLPRFPRLGQGREVEPGVTFQELNLGPQGPVGSTPGQGGKLQVYLPSGDHADRSLPCILITSAGTPLIYGNSLGSEPSPEHLPYARAGFAVVAYETDGALTEAEEANPTNESRGRGMAQFLAARAGLVNAHVALEFALARIPAVDPQNISAAGHSSAGTLAVLFAESEPRLRSCVAYAPALDVARRFGPDGCAELRQVGMEPFFEDYSPINGVGRLRCPTFLFHARDDSNVPIADTVAFVKKAQAARKLVVFDSVNTGDHYQSMIDQGIPHGIAWLKKERGAADDAPRPSAKAKAAEPRGRAKFPGPRGR